MTDRQRTTEWIGKIDKKYHEKQFKKPYQSTIAFCDWLEKIGYIQRDSQFEIIDLASGGGANILYMGQRFPKSKFVGVDLNSDLVESGNTFFKENGIKNCSLEQGDIYNLEKKYISKFDAIVSFQTLSWLPEFRDPIIKMTNLQVKWIALTSLFYDGPLSCTIQVQDFDANLQPCMDSFYNVYSLPKIKELFFEQGYSGFKSTPFEIDIDLPKPEVNGRGTYTEKLKNGKRLQFSGPLLMPWHFIAAEK